MYSTTIYPRFNETDALGHINNNVYTIWFDLCREPIVKLFNPTLELHNMNLIIAHTSSDFLQEVFYGEKVVIHTILEKIGNSSFTFSHTLYQKEKLCTIGKAVMIHFDHNLKKALPIPQDIKKDLEKHLQTSS